MQIHYYTSYSYSSLLILVDLVVYSVRNYSNFIAESTVKIFQFQYRKKPSLNFVLHASNKNQHWMQGSVVVVVVVISASLLQLV
jgi:hypothetical protein